MKLKKSAWRMVIPAFSRMTKSPAEEDEEDEEGGQQQHRDSTEALGFIACFRRRPSVGSPCPPAPSADHTGCLAASSWPCLRINSGVRTQTSARLPPPKPTRCWVFFFRCLHLNLNLRHHITSLFLEL